VLPLFWTLLAGVIQFGRAICVYSRLVEAVAAGARYASRVDFDEPSHTFVPQVVNVVVCGIPAGCGTPVVTGLRTTHVAVSWTRDANGVPTTVTVAIQNFSYSLLLRSFVWSGKPKVTARYAGVYKS